MKPTLVRGRFRNYANRMVEKAGGLIHLAAHSCELRTAIESEDLDLRLDDPTCTITCLWCAAELGRS